MAKNKKPVFEIIASKNPKPSEYTHRIYLHGKLFAEEAYRLENGEWWYDDNAEHDEKELMKVECFDLPDTLTIHYSKESFYKNFKVGYFKRIKNKISFDFFCDISLLNSFANPIAGFGYFFWLCVIAKKKGYKTTIEDIHFDLYSELKIEKGQTIEQAFQKAVKEFITMSKNAEAYTLKTEKSFLKKNPVLRVLHKDSF